MTSGYSAVFLEWYEIMWWCLILDMSLTDSVLLVMLISAFRQLLMNTDLIHELILLKAPLLHSGKHYCGRMYMLWYMIYQLLFSGQYRYANKAHVILDLGLRNP